MTPYARIPAPRSPYVGFAREGTLAHSMDSNAVEVIALTPAEWLSVLQDHAKKNPSQAARIEAAVALTSLKQYWTKTLSPNLGEPFVVPTGQFAADAYNFGKTMTALGVVGT
ncbi:MAG: hypothetical protein JSS05_04540 [Proteobacteria bacterium]|nr:hypothetical protein [Pseudomonadota bacterium]